MSSTVTAVTIPAKEFRTEVRVSPGTGCSPAARSLANAASPTPSITRFPAPSRSMASCPLSAHRRTVSELTPSSSAARPML